MAMNMDAMLRIRADVQGENNIRRLGNSMQGLEGRAKNAALALSGLRAGIAGLIGIVGGGVILGRIFGDTATLESQARSLKVLTGSAEQASKIIRELQSYGAVTPFESTELIETAKRLNAFGVETLRVVEVTKRLGDVAGATGANLGELATAYGQVVAKGRLQGEELLQFQERGVALSAELQKMYKLQGQEFQKALEGGRISAEAVEVAIERLTIAGGKYANGAIAQSDTLNGRLSTLNDTVTALAQTLGKVLEPALKGILSFATDILDTINKSIQVAINGPQNAQTLADVRAGKLPFGGPAAVDRIIGEQRRRQLQAQAGPGWLGLGFNQDQFVKLLQQQPEFRGATAAPTRRMALPPLLPGRADAGAAAASKAAAEARKAAAEEKRAAAEMERLMERRANLTRQAIELQEELRNSVADVTAAYEGVGATRTEELFLQRNEAITENDRLVKRLTLDVVMLAREINAAGGQLDIKPFEELINQLSRLNVDVADKTYNTGLKELQREQQDAMTALRRESGLLTRDQERQLAINEKLAQIQREMPELYAAQKDEIDRLVTASAGLTQTQERNKQIVEGIADSIGSAVKSSLDLVISGTDDWASSLREIAANLLRSIADQLLQIMVITPIVKGISGAFGFASGGIMTGDGPVPLKTYARGGIANSPQLAMFGEGSMPEAYVPLPDGRRIPVAMQGGGGGNTINVSVDAKGTQVQGNAGQGEALARAVAQAVQAELIRQKRPGGLIPA